MARIINPSGIGRPIKPAIPQPEKDLASHQQVLLALKEAVEILMAQRGGGNNAAVTYEDLIRLKIIQPDQAPQFPPGPTL